MPLCAQTTNTPIDILPTTFAITAVTFTSSTATYAAAGMTYNIGDIVTVSDVAPVGYNGTFAITSVVASTSFTVANTTNATVTTGTGTVFQAPTDFSLDDNDVVFLTDNTDSFPDPTARAAAATAEADAQTALTNAATAYAKAATSLQVSSATIVNASNQLTAINGSGVTVYAGSSPTSGARVVLNSSGIAGFNSGGSATFAIDASTGNVSISGASFTSGTISGGSLNIAGNCVINSSGFLTATGVTITGTITATSGSFTGSIYAASGTIGGLTIGSSTLYSGNITIDSNGDLSTIGTGYIKYLVLNGATIGSDVLAANGSASFSGNLQTAAYFFTPGHPTTANSANAYLNSITGLLARSTSSLRYKVAVAPIEIPLDSILALTPKSFKDRQEAEAAGTEEGLQTHLGLIAEEVSLIPMLKDLLVSYDEQGRPDAINYDRIAVALIPLIKNINERLKVIEVR